MIDISQELDGIPADIQTIKRIEVLPDLPDLFGVELALYPFCFVFYLEDSPTSLVLENYYIGFGKGEIRLPNELIFVLIRLLLLDFSELVNHIIKGVWGQ